MYITGMHTIIMVLQMVTRYFDTYYCDVIMARWRLKSPASRLFTQPFIKAQIKENIKAPRHWPLCGEFTGDSPHKGPVTWKLFPFDDVIMDILT